MKIFCFSFWKFSIFLWCFFHLSHLCNIIVWPSFRKYFHCYTVLGFLTTSLLWSFSLFFSLQFLVFSLCLRQNVKILLFICFHSSLLSSNSRFSLTVCLPVAGYEQLNVSVSHSKYWAFGAFVTIDIVLLSVCCLL